MPSVSASSPEDLHRLFVEAFNRSDLDTLLSLYEEQSAMVPKPHQLVRGRSAIRRALQQLLSLRATFALTSSYIVRAGDIALLRGTWRLNGIALNGNPVATTGNDVEVARRQSDGSWRFVIDHAYGASAPSS